MTCLQEHKKYQLKMTMHSQQAVVPMVKSKLYHLSKMHADKKKEEKKHFFHPSARSTKTLTTQSTPSNLKYVKVSKGAYNTQKLREDQDTVTFKDVTSSDEGIGTNSQKVKEKKEKN